MKQCFRTKKILNKLIIILVSLETFPSRSRLKWKVAERTERSLNNFIVGDTFTGLTGYITWIMAGDAVDLWF